MKKDAVIADLRRRIEDEKKWFAGVLLHYEGRSAMQVQTAAARLVEVWGVTVTDDFVHTWTEISYEIDAALVKGKGERGYEQEVCTSMLGPAEPPWELGELAALAGHCLVLAAEAAVEARDAAVSALLIADAYRAKADWIGYRGITKCRHPESKFIELEANVEAARVRLALREVAKRGGEKKNLPHKDARAWVVSEWLTHHAAYGGNKSEFARSYSARLKRERGVQVSDKQIRDVWLRQYPSASRPAGVPADRE